MSDMVPDLPPSSGVASVEDEMYAGVLADRIVAAFARMSGLFLSRETVGTALTVVTALAVDMVPGTVGAGISLLIAALPDQHVANDTAGVDDAVIAAER